jgi:membrane fusion protein, heavy metal efflux system
MLTKQIPLIAWLAIFAACTGCNRTDLKYQVTTDPTGKPVEVHLSRQEIEHAGIRLGTFSVQNMDYWVTCPGYLILLPVRPVTLSAPASGIIRSMKFSTGDYVESGTVLLSLENPDLLRLQQEFLEAENQMEYLQEDYKRQGELTVENATSLKKMQTARRDYQTVELKLNALRAQLDLYGIPTDSLSYKRFQTTMAVRIPVSGYLSQVKAFDGNYTNTGDKLAIIVKGYQKLLKISVHEKYLPYIKKDQAIEFYPAYDSLSVYTALVNTLPGSIDPGSHSAVIYCTITGAMDYGLPGMSVKARIRLPGYIARVVPSGAVLRKSAGEYLYTMKNGDFIKIPVRAGRSNDRVTEIIDAPSGIEKDSVVVQGTQSLDALFDQP